MNVYPDAAHAFLNQSEDEPGRVASILARITDAGYQQASARDARRRIIAFFDAHLKV
jgi:carboxymethylenebutenolidase